METSLEILKGNTRERKNKTGKKKKEKKPCHPTAWLGDCRITGNPLGGTADPPLKHPEPVSMVTSLQIYGETWPSPLGVCVV